MSWSKESYKKILRLFIICMTLLTIMYVPTGSAQEIDEPKVLVIYSTEDGEISQFQRYLDLIIGHFSADITLKSSDEVTKSDLTSVTHLFYYGQVAGQLPSTFLTLFDDYEGTITALGYNSEQLGGRFDFINVGHEAVIEEMHLTATNETIDITDQFIIQIETAAGTEILLEGISTNDNKTYPVLVKQDKQYYYAIDYIYSDHSIIFGEMLHEVFETDHEATHPGYIRLEDVHPLVDPKPLKEIASVLKEKQIPYMIAVIPIYTNPETGREHTFADSPKLLKVLKQIQKDGGSIILHGYTHQFRLSETGEGFEFWDVENNSPIYAPADSTARIKQEQDFQTKAAYEHYLADLKAFEREYIETKITSGIHELAKYGLYPLAFEAPHYTMSQQGYQILSEYFSTYVGQVQLSDKDWEIMNTTAFIGTPSLLHGMKLLPETMGYVDPDDPEAIPNMIQSAEKFGWTRDGMFAAFYHPYLGVDGFKALITELEKLPSVTWVDLKQMDNWVKAENVSIQTGNGKIGADIARGKLIWSSLDAPLYYLNQFVGILAWGMAIVGAAAVLAFISFTIHLRRRKNQNQLEG